MRGALPSIVSLGSISPSTVSPANPSVSREASTGPLLQKIAVNSDQMAPSGAGQQALRLLSFERKDTQAAQSNASWLSTDSRLLRSRTNTVEQPQRSTSIPTLLRDGTSDSSKSSTVSTFSGEGTASSSNYSSIASDEGSKAALSLPPLADVRLSTYNSTAYLETRNWPGQKASAPAHYQPSNPLIDSSSSSGMKFESFQLPLPHNISFGQHPLPRSECEGKLANIFDLQDIPRERNFLRHLTLDREQKDVVFNVSRDPPEPQHPPHFPVLPSLPPLLHDDDQDNFPSDADPLSVLAYAGRLVGQENRPPA